MSDEKDRPNTEERYTTATHATSLVVSELRSGPADVLMAAAWSQSRTGAALMRLHSEYDGAEKPRKPSHQFTFALAMKIAKLKKMNAPGGAEVREAKQQANEWLLHEQKILLGKLKSLPDVRAALIHWTTTKRMHNPRTLVGEALMWWLDPTCTVCHGQRWQHIEGTPSLSERACPSCRGSGLRDRPFGFEGAVLLSYIDDSIDAARMSMRKRLRVQQDAGK